MVVPVMSVLAAIVWDIDPVAIRLGSVEIRYYGIIFALTLLGGYILWRRQMRRGGYPLKVVDDFILWGVVAVIVGARLGHCIFYDPGYYFADPVTILFFWRGGLASHGATVGLIATLFFFARSRRLHPVEIMDRFSMSAAVGAAGVRLGNFMNSEIVGRAADVPWAVAFPRYAALHNRHISMSEAAEVAIPRHPSQLYEFAMGVAVLGLLVLADRLAGKEHRPLGLMTGLFLTAYFTGRFIVEFFKEYQAFGQDSSLTMGQVLSIPPFLAGVGLLLWAFLGKRKTPGFKGDTGSRSAKDGG